MTKEIQNLKMIWEDISIEITYTPEYFKSHKKIFGFQLAHLDIRSENKKRIPITKTGYRSLFTDVANIETYNSPIDFVKAWLKEKAKTKEWKTYKAEQGRANQLSLF